VSYADTGVDGSTLAEIGSIMTVVEEFEVLADSYLHLDIGPTTRRRMVGRSAADSG